jgi:hypothetical protein
MRQDVRKAHYDRRREIARAQALDDFEQVDLPLHQGVGPDHDVPRGVDGEVALAPRVHVVEVDRVLHPPRLGGVELRFAVQRSFRISGHGAFLEDSVEPKDKWLVPVNGASHDVNQLARTITKMRCQ